jgi:homoserine dehydrogenase
MRQLRLWVVGFGTVGQWLVRALDERAESLADRYGFAPTIVGIANARDGFIYRAQGLDVPTVLGLASSGRSIAEHPGIRRLPSALEGLGATEADLLVEVSASPPADGEPGFTHMREALRRRIPVVTSNKWPVALHGVELVELARSEAVAFRAESTVMSGTPVLSTLVEGLAGATPLALRGLLNATANFILSAMTRGKSYEDALAEAQAIGLAERDPAADVDGHDAKAKAMILAALVFGRQLRSEEVVCSGIAGMTRAEMDDAARAGARIKLVATLEFSEDGGTADLKARVEPLHLRNGDPLAHVDGVMNAVVCRAEPVGEVTIIGPGAGLALAGQGVLSDLLAVAGMTMDELRP